MFGLVDADFAAAGENQGGEASPALFGHRGDWDIFLFEVVQG